MRRRLPPRAAAVAALLALAGGTANAVVGGVETGGAAAQALPQNQALSAEADQWRPLLSNGRRLAEVERLLVVDAAGVVLAAVDGRESRVVLPEAVNRSLNDPARRLTLIHNHPSSSSFSAADLAQLGKPGVARLIVLGHDGSVYEAAAGLRYDAKALQSDFYNRLMGRIGSRLDYERRRTNVEVTGLDSQVTHLVALALHRSGLIVYRAVLTRRNYDAVFAAQWLVEEIVRLEARHVEQALGLVSIR